MGEGQPGVQSKHCDLLPVTLITSVIQPPCDSEARCVSVGNTDEVRAPPLISRAGGMWSRVERA